MKYFEEAYLDKVRTELRKAEEAEIAEEKAHELRQQEVRRVIGEFLAKASDFNITPAYTISLTQRKNKARFFFGESPFETIKKDGWDLVGTASLINYVTGQNLGDSFITVDGKLYVFAPSISFSGIYRDFEVADDESINNLVFALAKILVGADQSHD